MAKNLDEVSEQQTSRCIWAPLFIVDWFHSRIIDWIPVEVQNSSLSKSSILTFTFRESQMTQNDEHTEWSTSMIDSMSIINHLNLTALPAELFPILISPFSCSGPVVNNAKEVRLKRHRFFRRLSCYLSFRYLSPRSFLAVGTWNSKGTERQHGNSTEGFYARQKTGKGERLKWNRLNRNFPFFARIKRSPTTYC